MEDEDYARNTPAEEEELALAQQAKCARCKVTVVDEASILGAVMVNYYLPALEARWRLFLCGSCGLAFREFMHPELAEDETFQAVVGELRSRW